MSEETITITMKLYNSLVEDSRWLTYLERAGVDNWSGYDFAIELRDEDDQKP